MPPSVRAMHLRLLLPLLIVAAGMAAEPTESELRDARVLAAARAADRAWQLHVEQLTHTLRGDDIAARIAALGQVVRLEDPATFPLVLPFLDAAVRSVAELEAGCLAVAALGIAVSEPRLRALATHADERVRISAMNALTRLGRDAVGDWKAQATAEDDTLRSVATASLGSMGAAEAGDVLVQALAHDRSNLTRRSAAISLGRLGDKARAPALLDALQDADPGVRVLAARALVLMDYKPAIPWFLRALESGIAMPQIDRALEQLSGQDFGFDPHADLPARNAAIARGDVWWGGQAATLGAP